MGRGDSSCDRSVAAAEDLAMSEQRSSESSRDGGSPRGSLPLPQASHFVLGKHQGDGEGEEEDNSRNQEHVIITPYENLSQEDDENQVDQSHQQERQLVSELEQFDSEAKRKREELRAQQSDQNRVMESTRQADDALDKQGTSLSPSGTAR